MDRRIVSFRIDDDGHWVGVLDCHHGRHFRHQPPWWRCEWVQTNDGRQARIGQLTDCPKCEWIELPESMKHDRTTARWDEASIPRALLRNHSVAPGVWGRLSVFDGTVRFRFDDGLGGGPEGDGVVPAGGHQLIPPERPHRLEVIGPVELAVEFYVNEN